MEKGQFYETKAIEHLKLKGYKILETNFRTRFGEIDVIGKDRNYVALIEVKARRIGFLVSPKEAIDRAKQTRLELAAKTYSKRKPDANYRFDVVSIVDGGNWRRYELIKGAFYVGEIREQ